jgi:protein-S-isoprenylcysteine O-methyltransferase Ste14
MTAAHLVFAAPTTAYIFAAIQFEERDLIRFFGDDYKRCREQALMILPLRFPRRKSREISAEK